MIILSSGDPDAKVEGDQIAVSFPSGKDTLTVALDLHQTAMLIATAQRAFGELEFGTRQRPVPACAHIIAFTREG